MIQPRTSILMATLLLLTACQVPTGKPTTTTKPSAKPTTTTQTAAAGFLVKPTEASTRLAGRVEIDAHYLLGAGKGKLIGSAAGNVVAAGGGNIIGSAAGNLIGSAAGNLIGSAAGNLIGKRKFEVLADAAGTLTLGQTLPAAEMEIMVYGMADGQPLTLGHDKDGKPVLSIYTDAKGDYQVYLPSAITGKNVRVVALVPGSTDARLDYQVVSSFGSTDASVISEDTALMTAYYTEAFVSRLERLFLETKDNTEALGQDIPAAMAPIAGPIIAEITAATKKAGVAGMSADKRRALTKKAADTLLADVSLSTITLRGTSDKVLPKLVEALQEMREAAGKKMRENGPDYFNQQPWVVAANAERPAADKLVIKRPSDLNDFVLRAYLTSAERGVTDKLKAVYASIDVPDTRVEMVSDAMEALSSTIMLSLLTNADARKRLVATIEAGK